MDFTTLTVMDGKDCAKEAPISSIFLNKSALNVSVFSSGILDNFSNISLTHDSKD